MCTDKPLLKSILGGCLALGAGYAVRVSLGYAC